MPKVEKEGGEEDDHERGDGKINDVRKIKARKKKNDDSVNNSSFSSVLHH